LISTINHQTFDKDIKEFVISGAKELISRENGQFINYNIEEKEIALRKFENTPKGSRWLSRIMILSMEALLSDPIYGGNIGESGWRALHINSGEPKPKSRYINL
nr:gluconate 2-dehydrogenase subunit 3 family protein [Sulfurovaceae bacterium]